MEPGQDGGADEELVEIEEGAQDSPLVRELARIAQRAGFITRGRPDWGTLAAHSGLSPATLRAVVKGRAVPQIPLLEAVADFARAHDPTYNRVRLLVAMGWLSYEDVVAYALDQRQTNQENLAAARRIIAWLRAPGTIERLRQLDTPEARELLTLARRLGLDVPGASDESVEGENHDQ